MNKQKLKNKNIDELKSYLKIYFYKQFNVRLKINTGQLQQTHLQKKIRNIIAYIKMLIKEKEIIYNEKQNSKNER